jgi:hypothetical protein
VQHLDLEIDFASWPFAPHMAAHSFNDVADVPIQIIEGAMPAEIEEHLLDRGAETQVVRVVAAVRRRRRFDVLRGDGRPDKDEVVVEVTPVHHLAENRVEKGLGKFWLLVADQAPDVEQLDVLPGLVIGELIAEQRANVADGLFNPIVIELNAIPHRLLGAGPIGLLETLLRTQRGFAKQTVVLVEALDDDFGRVACESAVQGDFSHGLLPEIKNPSIVATAQVF